MKKILVILLILALGFSIAGCAGTTPAATTKPAATTPAGTTPAGTTAAATTAATTAWKPATIVFWQTNSGPADKFQPVGNAIIAKYNTENKKNTTVKIEWIGSDNYQVLLTAVAAGNAPDCAVGFSPQPMQYGLIGEGLDLTSIYKEWVTEKNPIVTDIKQEYWDFYTSKDGILYGIPFRYDPRYVSYRNDMFKEAGITKMPTTWSEFTDVCRTLKTKFPTKIPFGIAGASFMAIHAVIGFGANNDIGWVDKDLKPTMTNPKWIEMLTFFGTLRKEGLISAGSASYASADLQKLYAAGECVMIYGGVPTFIRGTDMEAKTSIMPPLKGISGSKQQTYAWITGCHGLKQSDYPDQTKAFLKWWSENTYEYFTTGGSTSLPIRTSHQQDAKIKADRLFSEAFAAVAVGCVTNAYPVKGLYLEFAQIEGEGIPGNALREVMEGKTNYAELAKKYEDQVAAVFK